MVSVVESAAALLAETTFLARHKEKEEHNQYWYSQNTINALVQESLSCATCAAFLSTPSLYFSLPQGSLLRTDSWLFDYDKQWQSVPHFQWYDYKEPDLIPEKLRGQFDCVVIDPPFITREVWELYARAAKLLLKPDGKVIASTVAENAPLMEQLFGAKPCAFKPSIPNLVYQYNLYTNFTPSVLSQPNPEIPEDD